jgi:hypothetical protein
LFRVYHAVPLFDDKNISSEIGCFPIVPCIQSLNSSPDQLLTMGIFPPERGSESDDPFPLDAVEGVGFGEGVGLDLRGEFLVLADNVCCSGFILKRALGKIIIAALCEQGVEEPSGFRLDFG